MDSYRQTLLTPEIPPRAWDAEYIDSASPFHSQNHFIDALRPALTAVGLKNGLKKGNCKLPDASASDGIRKQAIRALVNDYFIPVQEVQDLYDKIDSAIKDGYKDRGCSGQSYQKQLLNLSCAMKDDKSAWLDNTQRVTRVNSFFIYGATGSGKSVTIQRCLRFYPQVIWHQKIGQCQIVHLTVDLSGVQTPLEYCALFLRSLEEALGPEKYAHEVEVSRNVSAALLKIESLVLTYNVGILVVDSLESLNDWEELNKVRLLKHFRSLGKQLPILYSGTSDVLESIALEMPWMLSALSFGSIHWDPLKQFDNTSEEAQLRWSLFTLRLWNQQCLKKNRSEITEEIKVVWYDACQGGVELAISFFSLCQIEAISSGEEVITTELMRRVRHKEFKPIEHALTAYKNNDIGFLSIIKGADVSFIKGTFKKPRQNKQLTKVKKVQSRENQMSPDFKKIPKKDWCKLPCDDLRYKFISCEEEKFYEELKNSNLVLTMKELMGNVQFSKTSYR